MPLLWKLPKPPPPEWLLPTAWPPASTSFGQSRARAMREERIRRTALNTPMIAQTPRLGGRSTYEAAEMTLVLSDRGFGPQRKRGRVERKVSVLNRSSKKAVYKVANP
jgi:hypothetical protein